MKNNMFDPDMFKSLDKMINGLGNLTNKPLIDTKIFKTKGIFTHCLNTTFGQVDEAQKIKIDYLVDNYKENFSISKSSTMFSLNYDNLNRVGHALYFKLKDCKCTTYSTECLCLNSETENIGKIFCEIIDIRYIKKGDFVGYNKKFEAKEDMKIALVNCGYSSGIDKDQNYFFLNGVKCPVLGQISMELISVDISKIENVSLYEKFDLFGDFSFISSQIQCSLGYLSTNLDNNKVKKIYI